MKEAIFEKDFFDKLHRIQMNLKMHLSQGMSGAHKSGAKGSSVEFSDFREYILGDDIRRIDWNAYGRTDKLYIKQFMEEKEAIYQIYVDTSRSMDFGEPKKSKMALQVAGAFAYLILGNLDRVSVNALKENSLQKGKGMTGQAAFPHILRALEDMEFDGKTTLNKSILSRPITAGGVSIIISDFMDKSGIEEAVKYLAYKKQTMVLIQVLSREEIDIDYETTMELVDCEDGERKRISMSNAVVKSYGQALLQMQQQLQKLAGKYGARYVCLCSDESLEYALLHGFSGILQSK